MCEVFGRVDAKPGTDVFGLAKQRLLRMRFCDWGQVFFKIQHDARNCDTTPNPPPSLDVATLFISKGILK